MTDQATTPSTAAPASPGTVHSVREIESLIPHRWPFLLVDRITEYDPEHRRIVGIKAVTATEWFFGGHFPGLPVMPGVLQVEALAQTMAVYVAKQPGFGDRIGLFAGIDEVRFKRVVVPGDTLRLEVTMEKLGSRFGKGRGVASVERRDRLRGPALVHHPAGRGAAMTRIAVLSDIHGNLRALEAVAAEIRREKPDAVLVAGDLVLNGPDPNGCVDALRAPRVRGRADRVRQHRHRRRATSTTAPPTRSTRTACPRRSPQPPSGPTTSWATSSSTGCAACRPSAGSAPTTTSLVLVVHASPGSQTRGFDQALDPNVIFERASATDARVICVGHTHVPEVRDLGFKVIVNDGSCGYVFDGDPTASWAMVTIADGQVDVRRSAGRRSTRCRWPTRSPPAACPGDVYRAATVRTGKLVR